MSEPVTKIVLHIGAEKTGTTSLQAALTTNADLLQAEAGLLYPRRAPLGYGNAHLTLAAAFLEPSNAEFVAPEKGASPAELRQALSAAIASCRPRLVVLSAELFSSRFERPQIEELARFLAPDPVEIVYYARRQDEMAASSFGTGLVAGRREWFDIDDVRPGGRYFDHTLILDKWADVFGAASLKVRDYGNVARGGLLEDFLTQAGISAPLRLAGAPRLNKSISVREAQYLQALNQHLPTWEEALAGPGKKAYWTANRERVRLLSELRQHPDDSPPVTALIGEAESATIMLRFADTNARLAERYGVVIGRHRNGPRVAAKLEPLDPAIVERLVSRLRESDQPG